MAGLAPLRFFLLSPRKPLRWVFVGAPFVLPKKTGRARWKKKPLGPNLPGRASLGMRTVVSHDRIKPARSHPGALYLGNHPAFKPQVVTWFLILGCLSKRPASLPAAAPWGSFQRGGRSPLFVSFEGEVQEGETEIPLLACLLDRARPVFSTGRKWGAHMPSHHHGCPPS